MRTFRNRLNDHLVVAEFLTPRTAHEFASWFGCRVDRTQGKEKVTFLFDGKREPLVVLPGSWIAQDMKGTITVHDEWEFQDRFIEVDPLPVVKKHIPKAIMVDDNE